MLCGLSSARKVLKELNDDGHAADPCWMNELNKGVQNAEARSEAERQAPATQQELVRSQAGVKEMGKVQQCHYDRSKGLARLR